MRVTEVKKTGVPFVRSFPSFRGERAKHLMEPLGPQTHPYNRDVDWSMVANITNSNGLLAGGDDGPPTVPFWQMMAALFCVLVMCYFAIPRVDQNRSMAAIRRRQEIRDRAAREEQRKERMADVDYRQSLVDKNMVVKRILQSQDGQLALGDAQEEGEDDGQHSGGGNQSIDSTDENTSTCVICLDAFRVGDVVAWSHRITLDGWTESEETCNHVFHKDCIYPWLVLPNHDDCPSCRSVIIHEAAEGEEADGLMTGDHPLDQSRNSAYVIMHGLVSRARRASYSLIGHNIDVFRDDFYDDDEDDEEKALPTPPASPLRRVFSMGDRSPSEKRPSLLRRRPNSGTMSSLMDDSPGIALPNLPPPQAMPPASLLRRVVSAGHTPLVLSRVPSITRRLPPRPRPLRRMEGPLASGGFPRHTSVGRMHDESERTLDEEDEIIMTSSSTTTDGGPSVHWNDVVAQSLSDPTDEEDIILQ